GQPAAPHDPRTLACCRFGAPGRLRRGQAIPCPCVEGIGAERLSVPPRADRCGAGGLDRRAQSLHGISDGGKQSDRGAPSVPERPGAEADLSPVPLARLAALMSAWPAVVLGATCQHLTGWP